MRHYLICLDVPTVNEERHSVSIKFYFISEKIIYFSIQK